MGPKVQESDGATRCKAKPVCSLMFPELQFTRHEKKKKRREKNREKKKKSWNKKNSKKNVQREDQKKRGFSARRNLG